MTQAPNKKILSDITVHMKYAKYKPNDLRRETWDEIVGQYVGGLLVYWKHNAADSPQNWGECVIWEDY